MKCLVTGSAGFIGHLLSQRLSKEGYSVVAFDYKTQQQLSDKIQYITGDITDPSSLEDICQNIDVVFHCAALVKDYGPEDQFYIINVEGTKNIVKACQSASIQQFVFLSHIRYESEKMVSNYSNTKVLAEEFLMNEYKKKSFPVVIIRPGNVYGPHATTWVLRPLKAIQKNRISLINHGKGIFLHTYIDNLLDALLLTINNQKVIGKQIDITDGDNEITWGGYLNSLATFAGKEAIQRNMSKTTALFLSKLMMMVHSILKIEPLVTPMAVHIFTNTHTVSIEDAQQLLGYKPKIDYHEGMKRTRKWLEDEEYL